MMFVPMALGQPLVVNQIRILGVFNTPSLTSSTTNVSRSFSGIFTSNASVILYSQMGGASSNSYSSLSTVSVGFIMSASISFSSSSQTQGVTIYWPQGTSGGTSTAAGANSTTFSSTSSGTSGTNISALLTNFGGLREIDFPFAATLAPGNYILGFINGNSSISTTTAGAGVSAAFSLSCVYGGLTGLVSAWSQFNNNVGFGIANVGIVSTAGSTYPASFNAQSNASFNASNFRLWFDLINS
jgi:hypothetical protein